MKRAGSDSRKMLKGLNKVTSAKKMLRGINVGTAARQMLSGSNKFALQMGKKIGQGVNR